MMRKATGKEETEDRAFSKEKKIEEAKHQECFLFPKMTQWRNLLVTMPDNLRLMHIVKRMTPTSFLLTSMCMQL